jgi:hypothetical protein
MKRALVLAVLFAAFVPAGWWLAKACAPDFFVPVFTYKRHPDLPRSGFINGRLGVLQPTFARSYLVIAYRYLNGIGMNPREREQARDYYKDRETGSWDHTGTDWPAAWREVRSRIKSPPPPPTRLVTGGQLTYDRDTHSFALNCAEDAFRVAVHTLDARRSQFGVSSAAFRSWLSAQDSVFANCDNDAAVVPAEANSDLPPLIHADRDYQIAAAHFYAGNYQSAVDRFRRISQDATSPWSTMSRYLVARTLLRMSDDPKDAASAEARLETEARDIFANQGLSAIHGMTWNLVERAGIRQRDQSYFRELAHLLSTKGQDDGLREELWNYTDLYDGVIGPADPNAIDRPSQAPAADVSHFRDADLSDWIFCIQARDSSVFSHSLTRWKETRSTAWMLAALSHMAATNARNDGILLAAAAIPASSPAYLTAQFHVLRIYEELGEKAAARDGLNKLLSSPLLKDLPSSANLFRGLQMLAAPTLGEFLQFAARKPVMITLQMNFGEAPDFYGDQPDIKSHGAGERFDRDATRVLNRNTPFRLLKEAALAGSLPPELRGEALMTAFTRGLMLGEDLPEIANKLAEAAPDVGALTNAYLNEKTEDGRRFAAAFLLLHRPEARPYFGSGISRQTDPGKLDSYRDNWWCPMDIEAELDSRANDDDWYGFTPNVLQRSAGHVTPEFLTGSAATDAKQEFAKLGTLGAATDFLGAIVFHYAESHRDDSRIPEALHDLVRSGHYGCADVNTWKTTRAAFRMLHLRYPRSEWAKRTPTWFNNDLDIRQEIKSRQQPR